MTLQDDTDTVWRCDACGSEELSESCTRYVNTGATVPDGSGELYCDGCEAAEGSGGDGSKARASLHIR